MPAASTHSKLIKVEEGAKRPIVGRFAPSPTGRMHAGNIYAALMAWLVAKSRDGQIVLRIEDLDKDRSKPCYIDAIQRDFESLGLYWDRGPYFQHNRDEAYEAAFHELEKKSTVYPCFCSRADLHAASAPHHGEKLIYPGTCKLLTNAERDAKSKFKKPGFRMAVDDSTVEITDLIQGRYRQNLAEDCGDFLIRRSDGAFAYQLAVVVDDAEQGITSITRGVDLLCSTPQQVYLQRLLRFNEPEYSHIPLLVAEKGRRLSKRDKDASLDELLLRYKTPEGVIGHIAHLVGLMDFEEPILPAELLESFSMRSLNTLFCDKIEIQWRP